MTVPRVAIVVNDHFSPFHFAVPHAVFSNRAAGERLFEVMVCAGEPGRLTSDAGLSIDAPYDLAAIARADIVVLPYWHDPAQRPHEPLLDAIRAAHAGNTQIVGLCLGTYVLAYAGLLAARRAATHWEYERDFERRFPDVQLDTNALYVEDGTLLTSAGTGAGLDCCLHLVRQRYGSAVANKLARRMVIPPHREGGQAQFIEQPVAPSTQDATINALLDHLRGHLAEAHDLLTLSARARMSRRTLTRHFLKATGLSVGDWLVAERLKRSQQLLESTGHSVEAIAELVGFQSAAALRQHFKTAFSVTPRQWRRTFGEPAPRGQACALLHDALALPGGSDAQTGAKAATG
ncbi:GlxA family transcriptional regulator [Chitinasiproducens palmae]|uniref:Transcriptional regulator GlxA family, contains an amidase domain and an AraC-type DNA-binding HTH domain n=1 Tax=Chitinasiproducens palmae TaxID=1770053 RepID=A0A1H2PIG1_9BURK|nr:helix-turn-helix domain-containing protein [Chitinasiproducens palmae]SDV46033.1 Transcriptional regulator GlxA family, contains an amidase domain and an AraC-type DNA-binding HTH domain [Chitinasiproducens palmae]